MQKCHIYYTPNKNGDSSNYLPQTAEISPQYVTNDGTVDYKNKTFKLMKQLAQSQVNNKKMYTQIRQLQTELQKNKQNVNNVMKYFNVHTFEQIFRINANNSHSRSRQTKNEEWSNIIEQYKKIINTQQYKYVKLEQQLKINQIKLKKYQQEHQNKSTDQSISTERLKTLEQQFLRVKEVVIAKEGQVKSLSEQLDVIKQQYKSVLVDRQQWKQKFLEVQNKYNLEIQHFEQMEKHVQERLLQVERQMNYYKEERQNHLEKIDRMKKQLQLNQSKSYFSFGGVKQQYAQTDFDQQESPFNQQCLQISIKTLLEQNAKLKDCLLTLYLKKTDQQLPNDVQMELKILLNMHEHNSKDISIEEKKKNVEKQQEENHKDIKSQENVVSQLQQVKQISEQFKDEDCTDRSTQQTQMMQHNY